MRLETWRNKDHAYRVDVKVSHGPLILKYEQISGSVIVDVLSEHSLINR